MLEETRGHGEGKRQHWHNVHLCFIFKFHSRAVKYDTVLPYFTLYVCVCIYIFIYTFLFDVQLLIFCLMCNLREK